MHTFFRWALKTQRMASCYNLFAGKLALHDLIALEPHFDRGSIAQPRCLPPWVRHSHGVAGMLAFSLFANQIRVDRVDAEDRVLHPQGWQAGAETRDPRRHGRVAGDRRSRPAVRVEGEG